MIDSAGPSPMQLTAGLGRGTRRAVSCAGCLLALAVMALALHQVGLIGAGFDGWVYDAAELLVAGLVAARAVLVVEQRRAWLTLAAGIALYATGDLIRTPALEHAASISAPTPADALHLLLYPCACAAILGLAGRHARDVQAAVWLDLAIGGLALAAAASALVLGPVIDATHGTLLTVTRDVAYPLADAALLLCAFSAFLLCGRRPGRAWTSILLGVSAMALADSIHVLGVAEGRSQPGTALGALWPCGLALLAFAAWSSPQGEERRSDAATMVVPCLSGALALGLLIRANYVPLSVIPEALAGLALLVVGLRFAATFKDVRRLSGIRERQARTDQLTGLANRRRFYAQLSAAIDGCRARGASFALLTIDLDRFKELNDTLGHHAGDLLLQQVGPRVQGVVRGDAVARLGGDEFGLILRDASASTAAAERIHQALARPFELEDLSVSVQASIGIAIFPEDAQSGEGLLQRADVAMHQAKADRTRYAFYAPSADTHSRERLGLIGELKGTIEQGGLVVHYQPQVDLRTNTVSGVEALVRWQHPQRGLLAPDQFVPIAEQTGVMRELTASVLEQALGQQRAWLDEGRELSLAVNVSATNLLDAAFLEDLRRRLERWRTPPGMLRLEITESVLIAEGSRVRSVIDSLGDLGVNLSLDDFGTGYSPLSYLREVPVTELKIDRSFIEAMMSDRDTATIVAAVIGLAHRLGIDVVAEGIETAGQLEMLRSFECPFAQGYLFSRPLPAQVIGRWLREDALSHIAEEVLAADPVGAARAQLESRAGQATAGAPIWPGPAPPDGARSR
jgi:diguanylate cyclase (GGDEF)-like protein